MATNRLSPADEARLTRLAETLIDQRAATTIVPPHRDAPGYWFGGGNLIQDADGSLLVVGRYRNQGDSRTGVGVGERGLELVVLRSTGPGGPFRPVIRLPKRDLGTGDREVLSIEGAALRRTDRGYELFVSSEKTGVDYPADLEAFRKPGTGVWTIDRLAAASIEALAEAVPTPVWESSIPNHLHVKDPLLYERADGSLLMLACTHPFCWTSSNAAYRTRNQGQATFGDAVYEFFPRGAAWDVAMSRVTCVIDVPPVGVLRDHRVTLVFYDGGECVREHEEHRSGVHRPRGYSCEELGGVGYFLDGQLDAIHRLSLHQPMFVSPWGTGASRYVDVLSSRDCWIATWQQSQPSESQPLVMNVVDAQTIEGLLAASAPS